MMSKIGWNKQLYSNQFTFFILFTGGKKQGREPC